MTYYQYQVEDSSPEAPHAPTSFYQNPQYHAQNSGDPSLPWHLVANTDIKLATK